MGDGSLVWLAVFGGIVAAACAIACACACAWLAGATRAAASRPPRPHGAAATTVYLPPPAPVTQPQPYPVRAPAPLPPAAYVVPSADAIPGHVVLDRGGGHHAAAPHAARAPIVLEGRYPQLGAALGTWLQVEPDEVERIRIARDLGTIGGAGSARALLDGVRTGVLSPTIAADQLERGGFESGIAVAAALGDPDPTVRALATSLVGRTTPLEPARLAGHAMPPMPDPPGPQGPQG